MSHFPFASVQVRFGVSGAQFVVYISVAGVPPGLMTILNKLRKLSQRSSVFSAVSFMIISFDYPTPYICPLLNTTIDSAKNRKEISKERPILYTMPTPALNERKAVDHVLGIVVAGIIVASVHASPSISLNVAS